MRFAENGGKLDSRKESFKAWSYTVAKTQSDGECSKSNSSSANPEQKPNVSAVNAIEVFPRTEPLSGRNFCLLAKTVTLRESVAARPVVRCLYVMYTVMSPESGSSKTQRAGETADLADKSKRRRIMPVMRRNVSSSARRPVAWRTSRAKTF